MAISTSDIDALPDWSVARTLKAAKNARMNILMGGVSRSMNGRTLTMADLSQLEEVIQRLEAASQVESNDGNMHAYVSFGRPQ